MFFLLRRSSTSSLRTSSPAASARIRTASCCLRCVSIRIRVSSLSLCRRSCCTIYAVLTCSRVVHCKHTVSPLREKRLRSVLWLCTVLCAPGRRLSRRARAAWSFSRASSVMMPSPIMLSTAAAPLNS
ncbi:hypothetical protein BD310DRAFT_930802 [Dichomitus squalens]|uniref:Uncharacterized protein n=1 Tax=Dichomitus squalens TaxID=114155 RepID=A0A4Q9PQY4_9APHY|nr:hypothetical protein BD310DRAFT_930802 [Dichomitus squalens]